MLAISMSYSLLVVLDGHVRVTGMPSFQTVILAELLVILDTSPEMVRLGLNGADEANSQSRNKGSVQANKALHLTASTWRKSELISYESRVVAGGAAFVGGR
jgi:hypothetical protein